MTRADQGVEVRFGGGGNSCFHGQWRENLARAMHGIRDCGRGCTYYKGRSRPHPAFLIPLKGLWQAETSARPTLPILRVHQEPCVSNPDSNVRFVSLITKNTYGLILAGGRGSRLRNLTDWRAKPAVPFGGKFRIIDFPLSNCVNSGIRRIGVATQYKSHSLIRHIQRGWSFLDGRFQEFVDLLPASQRTHEETLVPGHRGRGVPESRHPALLRSGLHPDPGRRPRLQDGLRQHARVSRVQERGHDGGLHRGAGRGSAGHSA